MDGVEIVMSVEERCGIKIVDAEAEKVRTPAMLIDLVAEKLRVHSTQVCQSQRSFHLLRRVLVGSIGKVRKEIAPSTPIRSLVTGGEDAFWNQLKADVGARSWPKLGLHKNDHFLALTSFFASWIGATVGLFYLPSPFVAFPLMGGLAIAVAVYMFVRRLLKPREVFIPAGFTSLSDLVPFVATSNQIDWSREDVARVVREVVVETLCLSEGRYREEADFVKDLGLV